MFTDEYKAVCKSADAKVNLLKRNPLGYFLSSVLAGLFISFGSYVTFVLGSTVVGTDAAPFARLLQSIAFAAALSLVVMAGAELFTGNNFVLSAAAFRKQQSWKDVFLLFAVCWVGNLVGSLLSVLLFQLSGVPTGDVGAYFCRISQNKVALAPAALLLRAFFCNILVCLAVWCSIRMKSESGKLIMVFWCIFVFMVCGFEHSIANMSIVGVGLLNGAVSFGQYLYSILLSTIGNMLGGIFAVALPYHIISKEI